MKLLSAAVVLGMVGLVCGLLTGCNCKSNKKAGIASITCQPEDQEVYLNKAGNHSALFTVETGERACRYQWVKREDTGDACKELNMPDKMGGTSKTLKLEDVKSSDGGFYACVVVRENGAEPGDVVSKTRWAELRVYPVMENKFMPQALTSLTNIGGTGVPQISSRKLSGAVPGTTTCIPNNYVASLSFPKDDAGAYFYAPTLAGSKCDLSITQVNGGVTTQLSNTKFAARWNTPDGSWNCVADKATTTDTKTFNVTKLGIKHTFTIYFTDPQPNTMTNKLRVLFY